MRNDIQIDRRIDWLNRNGKLCSQIDFDAVFPALDCIGNRQSMRVLRRLEESAATVLPTIQISIIECNTALDYNVNATRCTAAHLKDGRGSAGDGVGGRWV